ncbi:hypothetical protein [Methanotorris formicicus]|uniref:Nucleic acid binding OB-fold tRNA/helicase-type n=1 Tax=Methanotorris formicicus Mc-S-70 TaxID=647171 RepID=H1KZX3_9EURY|nr:hypothetical protein [Methanotorris formicicus]EHP85476.1 nucleic acid binding OB-fold tRNA/helicase-type [Methanotorris formicicus Mc-S-70]
MYRLKKIGEIKDIDEKVAIIGKIKDIGEKIMVEDGSGEILVSLRKDSDAQLNINGKVLVFGTTKLTPKGLVILGDVVPVDDAEEELLMEFEEIIKNINKT